VLHVRHLRAVGVGDPLFRVGLQIAVGVTRQPQVRRFGDEDATIEHLERARQHQLVEKDGLLVHLPVAVGVLEHADAADWLQLGRRRHVLHVARHLDDPQASIRIPIDDDGLLDRRLARDELEAVARRQHDGLHRRFRRQDRGLRRHRLKRRRPGLSALVGIAGGQRGGDGDDGDAGCAHVVNQTLAGSGWTQGAR
jgi:hypothetical protein